MDSGPSQATDLRQEAQRRLCSGNAAPVEGMTEVDAAGMDCYLSKPIKGEEMIELVERLGGRTR